MTALYLTIWASLVLFVGAEYGRAHPDSAKRAWWAFAGGLALALVHTLLAFWLVHGWSHDDAVAGTARQTRAVFGVSVGSGLYVNYVFFGVWFADALWWRVRGPLSLPPRAVWALRAFYLTIILNGAVVFAAGWRRAAGALVVAGLLHAWSRATPVRRAALRAGRNPAA